ncbi:acyl-CoA dehydrogenase C-terminal domain-containing protein [Pedomonas mirosovicensis]|uniref:acyl-CoA dehydrogenase C-terminal domain-containing protein n=1 Tax=Pedomonas mirosovicensis TaxID=2908641 RepID=UPI0021679E24|nr:acyl-CoA dehydrogenase C-terminal domain-containing protein [Pedomonas mirosovicensis]MCH8686109.1 acyl-CoA dehydrogenase C-terminal domain-containing protein [Pedomonas mirosovicensis]
MPVYAAPVKDTLFILNNVLKLDTYSNLPGFAEATPDMVQAILEQAATFAEEVVQPTNQAGDEHGCTRHEDGSVTTPPGFKEAYTQFVEGGWGTLTAPPEYGGQGLPFVLGTALEEYLISANLAFAMYPGLTHGATAAIEVVGSDEQKKKYLPNMISGKWCGTMNLTEPHCGTDLGLIRTKAEPQADGTYKITGTKIFISAGEHDLAENIIHLVLAKMPDSPDNVKGISLFLVPKFLVNEDGSLGARNAVSCGSIEKKMGIHGNATCVLNYDGATGWLVGEKEKGLAAMFIMMNAARLGVGLQGLAISEAAYQNAVIYARERLQGRALTGPVNKEGKADPIIVHPDVRRMLMDIRAFNEGARAMAMWAGLLVDLVHKAPTEEDRQHADDLIGLLTPVIKGYFTDKGFENAVLAQQVFGGHGYIREHGMEQFVRDARIAQIYEGANGIQALDLVGRKLAKNGGRALQAFNKLVTQAINDGKGREELKPVAEALERSLGHLQAATMWLMQNAMANPNNAGAAAYPYMHLAGLVGLGLMWLKIGSASLDALASGNGDERYLRNKLTTARYFADRHLPDTASLRRKVEAGAETVMALAAEDF